MALLNREASPIAPPTSNAKPPSLPAISLPIDFANDVKAAATVNIEPMTPALNFPILPTNDLLSLAISFRKLPFSFCCFSDARIDLSRSSSTFLPSAVSFATCLSAAFCSLDVPANLSTALRIAFNVTSVAHAGAWKVVPSFKVMFTFSAILNKVPF